ELPQFEAKLREWLARLDSGGHGLDWAEALLDLVVEQILPGRVPEDFDMSVFHAQALQRAREAARLGVGNSFRAWWAGLLEATRLSLRGKAGVPLITRRLASGRRYRKAWLAGALEGNYLPGSSEDYFLPEELRAGSPEGGLPRRFSGGE